MFEEFYEMYEPEEQEVVALINRCIGGGFNWKGNFWGSVKIYAQKYLQTPAE